MSYLRNVPGKRQTPQSEPIPESSQVPNSAGGYSWQVEPLQQLLRFLVLGSEGGTYYITEQDLTKMNVQSLAACDPFKAIDLIVEVSRDGRAPKNDPALFALSFYAGHKDVAVRQYALDRLPEVARIGTHLFHFMAYVEKQRGWGRSLRRAIAGWYEREDLAGLAYDAVKYRQRDGWSHRDALRLSHPEGPTDSHKILYDWISRPVQVIGVPEDGALNVVEGFIKAQAAKTPKETAQLVSDYNLPREALNTDHLTSPDVWEALLYAGKYGMPLGALVRNLPTMTRVGLLGPMSSHNVEVTKRITDAEGLKRARVHPMQMLTALITYQQGKSIRGSATWQPVSPVVDALDAGFYAAFGAVEPTGKRIVLALDVSSSMDQGGGGYYGFGGVNGVPGLSPRIASAAMALVTANVEPNHYFLAFSDRLVPIEISPRERLDAVVRKMQQIPFGGTDCALPMLWAAGVTDTASLSNRVWGRTRSGLALPPPANQNKPVDVDAFVVYTDNETWAGAIHPSQALVQYRQKTGIPARSVVVSMTANQFTIADPADAGMLDVVGFDGAAPGVISDFIAGRI